MIPIDCKITYFSLYFLVPFLKVAIAISWCVPNYLFVENPLTSVPALYTAFKWKTACKVSPQSIQPLWKLRKIQNA